MGFSTKFLVTVLMTAFSSLIFSWGWKPLLNFNQLWQEWLKFLSNLEEKKLFKGNQGVIHFTMDGMGRVGMYPAHMPVQAITGVPRQTCMTFCWHQQRHRSAHSLPLLSL